MNKETPKENTVNSSDLSTLSNSDLIAVAKWLVDKNGKEALKIVQRKIDVFPKDSHCREKDATLMLLTEVEKLTANLS